MPAGPVLHNRAAVLTTVCRIPSRSKPERLIASSTSDVAACCSRASFSSSPRPTVLRFCRLVALRLVLAGLRRLNERDFRVFAALVLPPVLDDRAMSAPKGQRGQLTGWDLRSGRGRTSQNRTPPTGLMPAMGARRRRSVLPRCRSAGPPKADIRSSRGYAPSPALHFFVAGLRQDGSDHNCRVQQCLALVTELAFKMV
jgi:hypothetical protein